MSLTDPANRAVLTGLVRDTIDKAMGDAAFMGAQAATVVLYQVEQAEPLPVAVVHLDGDDQADTRELQNISGRDLAPGDRVAVLLVPPHGGFVLSPVAPPVTPAVRLDVAANDVRVAVEDERTPFPFNCVQIETRPEVLRAHLGFLDGWVEVLRTGLYQASATGAWVWELEAANFYAQVLAIDVHDAGDTYLRTVARSAAGPFPTTGAAGDWPQVESCATQAFYAEAGQLVRLALYHQGVPPTNLPTIGDPPGLGGSNLEVVWLTDATGEECESCS